MDEQLLFKQKYFERYGRLPTDEEIQNNTTVEKENPVNNGGVVSSGGEDDSTWGKVKRFGGRIFSNDVAGIKKYENALANMSDEQISKIKDPYQREIVERSRNSLKNKRQELINERQNPNDNEFSSGITDSYHGKQRDIGMGLKGGSGYQMHDWRMNLQKENLSGIVSDFKYMTGQAVGSIPLIAEIGLAGGATGISKLPGFIKTPMAFGSFRTAEKIAEKRRDDEKVTPGYVAKEFGKGALEGMAFNTLGFGSKYLTGKAGQGVSKIVKRVGGKEIPVKVMDIAEKGASYLGGAGGQSVAQSFTDKIPLTAQNYIKNVAGGAVLDAAMAGGGRLAKTPTHEGVRDQSAYSKIISKERPVDNNVKKLSKKYINDSLPVDGNGRRVKKDVNRDSLANNASRKAIDEYYRVADNYDVNSETYGKQYLTDVVRSIESRTGGKSGFLDDNGNLINAERHTRRVVDIENDISNIRDRIGEKSLTADEMVSEYMREIKEKGLDAELENAKTVDPKIVKDIKRYNKNKEHENAINEYVDSLEGLNHKERGKLKELYLRGKQRDALIADEVNPEKLQKNIVHEKIYEWFRTMPMRIKGELGDAAYQHIYSAIRLNDVALSEVRRRQRQEINEKAKGMSKRELEQVTIHELQYQVRRNKDTGELENFGEQLTKNLVDSGYIKREDVLKYDELNDRQKEFLEYIRSDRAAMWDQYNKMLKASGKKTIEGLGDNYAPILQKGEREFSNTQLEQPWLVSKRSDFFTNMFTKMREGGNYKIELDPIKIQNAYADAMNRTINTAVTANRMREFASSVRAKGNYSGAKSLDILSEYWSGNFHDSNKMKRLIYRLNSFRYASVLPFSVGTIINQATAIKATMTEFGVYRTLKAMEQVNEMKFNESQKYRLDDLRDLVPNLKTIQHEADIDLFNETPGKGIIHELDKLVSKGMWAFKQVDLYMREVTAKTAYDYYRSEKGFSHEDAQFKANEAVNATQGSGSRADLATIHYDALGKLLFSFQTFRIANLNYMASNIFGVDSLYEHAGRFKTEKEAIDFVNSKGGKGYEINRVEGRTLKDEPTYLVHHKQKTVDTITAMKRLLIFGTFTAMSNTMMEVISKLTGVKIFHDPAFIDVILKQLYGRDTADMLLGNKAESTVHYKMKNGRKVRETTGQKVLRVGGKAMLENLAWFPVLSDMAEGRSVGGTVLGALGNVGSGTKRFVESGKISDGIRVANELTSLLLKNPFYQPVKYGLNIYNNTEKKKRDKRARIRRIGNTKY